MNRKQQSGFTLIELVMVIAILGVLAATALPKFIDIKSDASRSALAGMAGALSSASSVNYAARTVNSSKGSKVANCTDVGGLLQGGLPAASYTITSAAIAAGDTATCTLTQVDGGLTASFSATGIN